MTKKEAFQGYIGNEAPLFFVCNGTRAKFLLNKEKYMSNTAQEQLPAPDFTLPVEGDNEAISNGKLHLADLRGKNVVLYFYPKED